MTRTTEQLVADLHVVIEESILNGLEHPKADKMVKALRAERNSLRDEHGLIYYDRERSKQLRRPLEEIQEMLRAQHGG